MAKIGALVFIVLVFNLKWVMDLINEKLLAPKSPAENK